METSVSSNRLSGYPPPKKVRREPGPRGPLNKKTRLRVDLLPSGVYKIITRYLSAKTQRKDWTRFIDGKSLAKVYQVDGKLGIAYLPDSPLFV